MILPISQSFAQSFILSVNLLLSLLFAAYLPICSAGVLWPPRISGKCQLSSRLVLSFITLQRYCVVFGSTMVLQHIYLTILSIGSQCQAFAYLVLDIDNDLAVQIDGPSEVGQCSLFLFYNMTNLSTT